MSTQSTATMKPTTTFETITHIYPSTLREAAKAFINQHKAHEELIRTQTIAQGALEALPKTPTGKHTKAVSLQLKQLAAVLSESSGVRGTLRTDFKSLLKDYILDLDSKVYTYAKVEEVLEQHGFTAVTSTSFYEDYDAACKRLKEAKNREPNYNSTYRIDRDTDVVFRADGVLGGLYLIVRCTQNFPSPSIRYAGYFAETGTNYNLKEEDGLSNVRLFNSNGRLVDVEDAVDSGTYNQPGDGSHRLEHWIARAKDIVKLLELVQGLRSLTRITPNRCWTVFDSIGNELEELAQAIADNKPLLVVNTGYTAVKGSAYSAGSPFSHVRHGDTASWSKSKVFIADKVEEELHERITVDWRVSTHHVKTA